MMLLVRWALNTLALFIVVTIFQDHIHYRSIGTLIVAALVLGLLNAIVKPVLKVLTFPITVVTLGLFLLILNGAILELTAFFVPGFTIDSFWWAVAASVVLTIVSWFTNAIGRAADRDDDR